MRVPVVGAVLFLVPSLAIAQGVSSATIDGVVTTADHAPVTALVTITNRSTGGQIVLRTGAGGRFVAEHLAPGGPYLVEARAVGYAPARRDSLVLVIGERRRLTFRLGAVALSEVRVVGAERRLLDASRTGASHVVSDSAIRRLPLGSRDFTELIQTAPGVVGTSVAGANNRMNNILVDGATDNDFFGLSRGTGTPGGQEGARSLPLEAVREFRVLAAPFDVRQGSFTGAQIDAVTLSGTNELHGSLLGFFQNQEFVGRDTGGVRSPDFDMYQYGGSIGGPIIRDRLHFFVAGELRHRATPFSGPIITPSSDVGIPYDSATRFVSILRGYGIEPGSFGAFSTTNDAANVFGKLSAPTGASGLAELSLTYAHGVTDDSIAPARVQAGDYRLTSAGFSPEATTWAGRGRWTTLLGRFANEALLGYSTTDEPRTPASGAPAVFVGNVGVAGARLIAGGDPSSQELALHQRAAEVTDNLTGTFGAHVVTIGAAAQLLHFRFANVSSAIGQYQFLNLDSLAAGHPSRFIRNLAQTPSASAADFGVHQLSLYAQDAWTPLERLTVTAGLRLDRTSLPDAPAENAALATSPFAINTSEFIGASTLLSPRLGVNWRVRDGTVLRGGAGLFTGRDPYSWLAFAYSNTGTGALLLNCGGAAAPAFVADPAAQPTSCLTGTPASAASISYFTPDFRMPQSVKLALGADQQLPWGVVASLDVGYARGRNSLYITDDNLSGPVGALAGEGGRVMYGSVAATSSRGAVPTVTPATVSSDFGPILRNGNRSGDRTYVVTAQIEKAFTNGVEFDASYTYMNAKDFLSLRDAQSVSNYGFAPVDGSLTDRQLATSTYNVPNLVTISGTANVGWGLALSLIYVGRSGSPFTYVVNGDANADGVGNRVGAFDRQLDDPVYVPASIADISLVRDSAIAGGGSALVGASASAYDSLAAFIASEPCLRANRGRLLPRNACRNPWQNLLNARLGKRLSIGGGRSVEIIADVFNVLNLLNGDWGLVRETGTLGGAGTENVTLLRLRGSDAANARNLYDLTLPKRNVLNVEASRWRLQLGARYTF